MGPQFLINAMNVNSGERSVKPFTFSTLTGIVTGITLAQANAGIMLVAPGYPSIQAMVFELWLRVNSASVGNANNILIQTTDPTPVVIATFANAQLTSGAKLTSTSTGVTLGAGFLAKLNPGIGIQLKTSGGDATGAFTLDVRLSITPR